MSLETERSLGGGKERTKEDYFKEQWEVFDEKELLSDEGFQRYFESLPGIELIFEDDGVVVCIDEGTKGSLAIAGSGILEKDFGKLVTVLRARGVKKVSYHAGCGASKLAGVEDNGETFAHRLAVELGVLVEKIEMENVQRPEKFHVSMVCYCSSDAVNPLNVEALKIRGFKISWPLSEDPLGQAKVAFEIAKREDHGFGKLINPEHPFVYVILARNSEQAEEIAHQLEKMIHENASMRGQTIVRKVVMPKTEKKRG